MTHCRGHCLIAVAPFAAAKTIGFPCYGKFAGDAFAGKAATIVHSEMALIRRLIKTALDRLFEPSAKHVREDDDAPECLQP